MGLSGLPRIRSSPSQPLSYLSGAALLVKTSVFFQVGMFDETLFLYRDDADFCWRLRLFGYEIAVMPDCLVFHQGSATFGKESYTPWYFILRNNLWVLAKNSPLRQLPARTLLALLESLISYIGYWGIVKHDAKGVLISVRGLIDGLRYFGGMLKGKRPRGNANEDPRIDLELLFPNRLRKILMEVIKPKYRN